MKVRGAQLENGLLHVFMEREIPEALKPRTIAIRTVASAPVIEDEPAKRKRKSAAAK